MKKGCHLLLGASAQQGPYAPRAMEKHQLPWAPLGHESQLHPHTEAAAPR